MSEPMKLVLMKWIPLLGFFALIAMTGVARAQDNSPLSTISGTVQDPNGAVIIGAQVELRSGDTVVQTTITDSAGIFKFTKVSFGAYDLNVQSAGFEPADLPVKVTTQTSAPLRVVLAVSGGHQEATITGDSNRVSTETSDNQDSNALSGQALSNIPVFDQDYVGTMSRFLDAGSVGTSGATLI